MVNFRQETLDALEQNGVTPSDVKFVTTNVSSCSFQEFLEMINGYSYDNSVECPYIQLDLKLVGNGWRLERFAQDNTEQWVFKSTSVKQLIIKHSDNVPLKWNIKYSFLP